MSVQINSYLIVGIELNYDDFRGEEWFNIFEPYMDSAFAGIHHYKGLCVISDGMNGEYIVVGRVLEKTKNYEYFPAGPLKLEVESATLEMIRDLIRANFDISFDDDDVKVMVLTHYR